MCFWDLHFCHTRYDDTFSVLYLSCGKISSYVHGNFSMVLAGRVLGGKNVTGLK